MGRYALRRGGEEEERRGHFDSMKGRGSGGIFVCEGAGRGLCEMRSVGGEV